MESDEFEEYVNKEELIWEVWLRIFMIQCMPTRDMYHEWLRVRANRSPEERYGNPE
jgi:hypothetical protein